MCTYKARAAPLVPRRRRFFFFLRNAACDTHVPGMYGNILYILQAAHTVFSRIRLWRKHVTETVSSHPSFRVALPFVPACFHVER